VRYTETGRIRDYSLPNCKTNIAVLSEQMVQHIHVKLDKGGVTFSGLWDSYNKSLQDFSTSESCNGFFKSSLQAG
jgi:hypothetical protein